MNTGQTTNALAGETSPYLLQHASNPVNWYPWGDEALERARSEGKPILLSIGYSACHWCHVMAHESFENPDIAALMNEYFINIKVDREERPDLDKIYQTAQQLLTRRTGGWPLTMFLTPDDHMPFFGGTYFPPESRFGMPGFAEVLTRIAEFYRTDTDNIRKQNDAMRDALSQLADGSAEGAPGELDPGIPARAVEALHSVFDAAHGGFGGAPKFPHASNIELLLDHAACAEARRGDSAAQAMEMATVTLKRMASGGIYDHLGGGFCRYAVDEYWMIPHFEKMLYDNGPLLGVYTDAWQMTGEPLYRDVALETAKWVMRDMQSPDGGYYSSLDADSEGHEGKFYVWTPDEVKALISEEAYAPFARRFGLDRAANFEGKWHLHAYHSIDEVAEAVGRTPEECRRLIDGARAHLLEQRNTRVWPGRDEKILTSWNALMIAGMAKAADRFGRDSFLDSAERALGFIQANMWRDQRLFATSKDGRAHLDAYLDDYAFLIDAILAVIACRWSGAWLQFAVELAEVLLQRFLDAERGGFWFTAHDHEQLIQRRKDFMDDSLPSGNGVAARALTELGHLIGEQRYLDAAQRTLAAASATIARAPHAHGALLTALSAAAFPLRQVVIRGSQEELDEWRAAVLDAEDIRTRLYCIDSEARDLPGLLGERKAGDGPLAYVCSGFECLAPVSNIDDLITALKPVDSQ